MSLMTDVVIVASRSEREALGYLNRWLAENDPRGQQLTQVNLTEGGGGKVTGVTTYAACFNYLNVDFADAIREAPWHLPSVVVAYFYPEDGETFVMSPARTGVWATRAPAPLDLVNRHPETPVWTPARNKLS